MTVNHKGPQAGPATMTIFFGDAAAATPSGADQEASSTGGAGSTTAAARTATIDMKHARESEILAKLLDLTRAQPVEASAAELAQVRTLQERRGAAERDAERAEERNMRRRRQQAVLEQARSGTADGQAQTQTS